MPLAACNLVPDSVQVVGLGLVSSELRIFGRGDGVLANYSAVVCDDLESLCSLRLDFVGCDGPGRCDGDCRR